MSHIPSQIHEALWKCIKTYDRRCMMSFDDRQSVNRRHEEGEREAERLKETETDSEKERESGGDGECMRAICGRFMR